MVSPNITSGSFVNTVRSFGVGLSLNLRDPFPARPAVDILNQDEVVISSSEIKNPLNSNGVFVFSRLPRPVQNTFRDNYHQSSGTLKNGRTSFGMVGVKYEAKVQQEARRHFLKAHHQALGLVGHLDQLNLSAITLLNIALRYDLPATTVLRLEERNKELNLEWQAFETADDASSEAWMDRVNEHIKRRAAAEVDGIRVTTYAVEFKLYRAKASLLGGVQWRDQIVRGWLGRMDDLKAYIPMIDEVIRDSNLHPVVKAAKVYQDLVSIHMFGEANGRVARLTADIILMSYGYPPLLIEGELPSVANLAILESPDRRATVPYDNAVSVADVVAFFLEALTVSEKTVRATGIDYHLPDYGELPSHTVLDDMTLLPHLLATKQTLFF